MRAVKLAFPKKGITMSSKGMIVGRFLAVVTIGLAWGQISSAEAQAPRAAGFPELTAAYQPVGEFIASETIVVGQGSTADDSPQSGHLLPNEAPILAFEENDVFLCATGDASARIAASGPSGGEPRWIRRILWLKPSVIVVDDDVRGVPSVRSLRWQLDCRSKPTIAGRELRLADTDKAPVCRMLWPADGVFRPVTGSERSYYVETKPSGDTDQVRRVHVFFTEPREPAAAPKCVVEAKEYGLELTVTTAERSYRVGLPPASVDPGWIVVKKADGRILVSRRPLPGGVLPHGPEGARLIERWDRAYRDGNRPPWDTRTPAGDLVQAVERGEIRPCRTVVLGCGSGTNAIYLAEKGFDVTAIDVAPTALGIAEAKARNAGVNVQWILADVLKLPELEPFDLVFDRGCYHNVRYVNAEGFVESLRRITRPGSRCLILSLNRDGPPGVREKQMREDFAALFEFERIEESNITTGRGGTNRREAWYLMLRRKGDP